MPAGAYILKWWARLKLGIVEWGKVILSALWNGVLTDDSNLMKGYWGVYLC